MGPVGILCIQRTINSGRDAGLRTGVGAAVSDLLYCLVTGSGMSIVTDMIEANKSILQVVGSVFLIVYALYMIIHNPVRPQQEDADPAVVIRDERMRDIVTGFLFTLSNPLIVFLIIPFMARFNFPMPEHRFYHIIIGYLFIVVGALLWWAAITFIVDKVRSKFNIRSIWMINRIMGGIILLLSLYGLATGTIDYLKQLNLIS
ncbi:MAG: LysE family transporter [Muribaculaceae bacterium]|nr:LysE family transporter [Muribaculaceae bacterium]MBR3100302.1 LysE family transporter [Muribaculaceae bacterium]